MIPPAPIFFPPALVSIPPAPVTIPSAPVYIPPAPIYIPPMLVYIPPAPVYISPAPVYIPPAPVYIPSAPVYIPPAPVYIPRLFRKYRLHPWLCVCARRSTVRVLEHPIRVGINAFAPEDSRETTAACARGTISLRPFAMHSPCTWACNCISSCLLGTSWIRTKADFI
jgi:hypothetical protein